VKRPVIIIFAALVLLASLPAFSQAQNYPKDAYVKTIHIVKIWTSSEGYKVQFFNSHSHISDIYVPLSWFNKGVNSRAEIVYGVTAEYPYITIVWVEGKFDHVTLHVLQDYNDLSWGELRGAADDSALFKVEEVPKEF
jgi:hypothetical protein